MQKESGQKHANSGGLLGEIEKLDQLTKVSLFKDPVRKEQEKMLTQLMSIRDGFNKVLAVTTNSSGNQPAGN